MTSAWPRRIDLPSESVGSSESVGGFHAAPSKDQAADGVDDDSVRLHVAIEAHPIAITATVPRLVTPDT